MNITVNRRALNNAIRTTAPAVNRFGGAMPVTAGVHLHANNNQLHVTCTNLDLTITTIIDADIDTPGSAVAPAALLGRITGAFDGDHITVTTEPGDSINLAAGETTADIHALPLQNWPRVTTTIDTDPVTYDTTMLNGVRSVLHAASTDPNRQILCGVLFSPHQVAATDSFRLAVYNLPEPRDGNPVIVPASTLRAALHSNPEQLEVRIGDRTASFTDGATTWVTRLIEGDYPNVNGLLNATNPHQFTVDADTLAGAVQRVDILGSEGKHGTVIKVVVDNGKLTVDTQRQDVGATADIIDADGDQVTIGFNPTFLLDLLEQAGPGDVTFRFTDALRVVLVTGEHHTFLLMPVRL